MLRLSAILLFLAVAILSVLAAPTPTADLINPFTLRQATRADIVNKRRSSPVRRQGPSALPFVVRQFRLRVPTDSPQTQYAGLYFVNGELDRFGGRTPAATGTTPAEATIYQLSSTGALQTSSDLTVLGFVAADPTIQSTVVLLTPAVGPAIGGTPLACSVGTNLVLACTDAVQSGRIVGINPTFQPGTLAFTATGNTPVVVEYL